MKITWRKLVTRRLAVQVAQAWNFGGGTAMENVYSVSILNTLTYRDDKKTEYYVDAIQHNTYVTCLYGLLKDRKFLHNFHTDAQKVLESLLHKVKKKFTQGFSGASNRQLMEIYWDFILPTVEQFYIRMWTVFNIAEPTTMVVRQELQKYLKDPKKIEEFMLKLSFALQPNDVIHERIDLLQIAKDKNKLTASGLAARIKKHTQKYKHIPLFDFDHEPYTEEHFLQELKAITRPRQELAEIEAKFVQHRKEREEVLRQLQPKEPLQSLLQFMKENIFLRDHRDMIRQKLNLELRTFYQEVGKRLQLTIPQVAVLTNDEIMDYLQKGKAFPLQEIQRREQAYLLIQKGTAVEIYSGDKAIKKATSELNSSAVSTEAIATGKTGCPGKVIGVAKIVYTNKDLPKVTSGDIMIATMTRQDFVPTMRRAAAIVTDEGGVTCHAAIISRELQKPCIVGAGNATSIFKDGEKVEVDATHGTIRRKN